MQFKYGKRNDHVIHVYHVKVDFDTSHAQIKSAKCHAYLYNLMHPC